VARPRRRRKRKPRGFSDRPWRGIYGPATKFLGSEGREKRGFLNTVSLWIAASIGISSAFTSCMVAAEPGGLGVVPSWIIGLAVGALAFNLAVNWLTKDRFLRP